MHTAAAALGLSALLAASATAFTVLKWAGTAYLVYVGLSLLASSRQSRDAPGLPAAALRAVFAQGFLANVLNPKVAPFFLAFLPQFIAPDASDKAVAFLFLGAVFNLNGTLWNLLIARMAARIVARLRWPVSAARWLIRDIGVVLIALGLRLAAERSR